MLTLPQRWRCANCRRVWKTADLLYGPYSDGDGASGYGCPRCRMTEVYAACDEPKCREQARTAWTMQDGTQRLTCRAHYNYWKEKR